MLQDSSLWGERVRLACCSRRLATNFRHGYPPIAHGIHPTIGEGANRRSPRRPLPGKWLAQSPPLAHAGRPMNSSGRSQNSARALVAAVLFAAFSWTLLVSVSPRLHGCIHGDANRSDHVCAITLIASGSYEHGAQSPLVTVPLPAVQFSKIAALTPCWVQSPFLGAHIFEHAPPARG